ncbi:hypothetical protein PARPLA_02502 [Rhodobacteraceae bacterium THAF1]|uniref:DNA repair protein n=1 Tax=Palleronia sp. THAF1 TaxID=2587842 RepID=UPI000F3AC7C9|nr:DNA repair protein [Palleronia sp. THAF1]QFU07982.1 hypothetical protein FIU81_04785 [Palleronia sp. THAF1]VDC27833.1 hypothetical protein PARPLA_02502 [Rhodobacteraceae bacterium THAF1]
MYRTTAKRNQPISAYFQWVATAILFTATAAVAGATLAAAFGYLPYLTLPLQFGDVVYPQAGLVVQFAVVLLLLTILSAMPSGFRVLRLERSHRDFAISMSDVAEAYHFCHQADRADTFKLSSEYDSVKERMNYLRYHPDLAELEPEVLEAAAEMSYASRDIAQIYSDENVARARGFLAHRVEEIGLFEERIEHALTVSRELRRLTQDVEIEEAAMESRLAQLEDEYGDLLSTLGFVRPMKGGNVIALPHATAAE